MSERKPWSEEEDHAIRTLVCTYGLKQWNFLSKQMQDLYGLTGRTGKQCRQRWFNHLNPEVNKNSWTEEEQKIVFESHMLYGNQWSQIAKLLPGRTDNAIKNYFYSILRRSIRRMNKFLGDQNSTYQVKQIKSGVLSQIFSYSDQTNIHTITDEHQRQMYETCQGVQDCLIEFSNNKTYALNINRKLKNSNPEEIQKFQQVILQIHSINQQYNSDQFREKKDSEENSNSQMESCDIDQNNDQFKKDDQYIQLENEVEYNPMNQSINEDLKIQKRFQDNNQIADLKSQLKKRKYVRSKYLSKLNNDNKYNKMNNYFNDEERKKNMRYDYTHQSYMADPYRFHHPEENRFLNYENKPLMSHYDPSPNKNPHYPNQQYPNEYLHYQSHHNNHPNNGITYSENQDQNNLNSAFAPQTLTQILSENHQKFNPQHQSHLTQQQQQQQHYSCLPGQHNFPNGSHFPQSHQQSPPHLMKGPSQSSLNPNPSPHLPIHAHINIGTTPQNYSNQHRQLLPLNPLQHSIYQQQNSNAHHPPLPPPPPPPPPHTNFHTQPQNPHLPPPPPHHPSPPPHHTSPPPAIQSSDPSSNYQRQPIQSHIQNTEGNQDCQSSKENEQKPNSNIPNQIENNNNPNVSYGSSISLSQNPHPNNPNPQINNPNNFQYNSNYSGPSITALPPPPPNQPQSPFTMQSSTNQIFLNPQIFNQSPYNYGSYALIPIRAYIIAIPPPGINFNTPANYNPSPSHNSPPHPNHNHPNPIPLIQDLQPNPGPNYSSSSQYPQQPYHDKQYFNYPPNLYQYPPPHHVHSQAPPLQIILQQNPENRGVKTQFITQSGQNPNQYQQNPVQ